MLDIIQLTPELFYDKNIELREKSEEVKDFGNELQKEIDEIISTLNGWKIAIGLSAPQVGIKKRIAIINLSKNKTEDPLIIVNPIITNQSGKKNIKKESCMSLPNVRGDVERRHKISIMFQDRFGLRKTLNAEGFLARVIMHEIDHLDGILFVDRMHSNTELEKADMIWE